MVNPINKLQRTFATNPRLILQLALLIIFLSYFGLPSLWRYLEGEVLTIDSRKETRGVPAPAITFCARSPQTGPWREVGGLQKSLERCNTSKDVFACMETQAWARKDVVTKAEDGKKQDMSSSNLWKSQFLKGFWSCHTFSLNGKIGPSDEIFFHLNRLMLYAFYIHGPDFFIQNYNPLAMPNNYGKLFPSKDCNSNFTLALTERRELNTNEDPCEMKENYSFVSSIEDSIAEKVGCVLEGAKATSEKEQCNSAEQYRFLEISNTYNIFWCQNLCSAGHITNCTRICSMRRTRKQSGIYPAASNRAIPRNTSRCLS